MLFLGENGSESSSTATTVPCSPPPPLENDNLVDMVSFNIKEMPLNKTVPTDSEISRLVVNKAMNYNDGEKLECRQLREIASTLVSTFSKSLGSYNRHGK